MTPVGKFLASKLTSSHVSNPTIPFSGDSQCDGVSATFLEVSTLLAWNEEPNDPTSFCLLDPMNEEHMKKVKKH